MKESLETKKVKSPDGTVCYFVKIDGVNKLHNWDSAAYIPQGNLRKAEYYLFGIKYSKEEWLERKADVNGVPWYKTAAGKQANIRV